MDAPYKWTKGETMLLLRLYLKHKQDFDEGRKKKAMIWQEIVKEMDYHGVSSNYVKLDRKFRNMSRTYFSIKRRNSESGRSWEYFDIMEEIFLKTTTHSSEKSVSDEDEYDCQPKVEIKPEPLETYPDISMVDESTSEFTSEREEIDYKDVDIATSLASFANDLDVQRLEELRAIRVTLEESNAIQRERNHLLQERNELLKQYLVSKSRNNRN